MKMFKRFLVVFLLTSLTNILVACAQNSAHTAKDNASEVQSAAGLVGSFDTAIANPRNAPCSRYFIETASSSYSFEEGTNPQCVIYARISVGGSVVGYVRMDKNRDGVWYPTIQEGQPVHRL